MAPSTVYNGENEHSQSLNSPSNTNSNTSGQSQQSSASVQSSSLLSIESSSLNARPSSLPVCSSSESKSIDDILLLPKAKKNFKQTRVGLTSNAQYVTASPFLKKLRERKALRDERERKKEITKIKSKPKQSKPKSKSKSKSKSKLKSKPKVRTPANRKQTVAVRSRPQFQAQLDNDTSTNSESDVDECSCGICDVKYGTDDKLWIECNECTLWFHTSCVHIDDQCIPDVFLCFDCHT